MVRGVYQTQFLRVRKDFAMFLHPIAAELFRLQRWPGVVFFLPRCFHESLPSIGSRIGECLGYEHSSGSSIDNYPPTDYYEIDFSGGN
jgi:hypothetical protein